MSEPIGRWNINANGFRGHIDINGDGNGNLTGTVDIDPNVQDQLQGVWNEAGQEITFNRVMNRNGQTIIQTYAGHLFLTNEPVFGDQGGPPPNPTFRLLAGEFDGIGSGAANGRGFFGWVARQRI